MGASPEPLLTIVDNVAETISLAGTQSMNNRRMAQVTWQGKELKEQGIVTCYIEDVLNNFGITNYRKEGPSTHRAGNLVHLKTTFQFNASQFKKRLGLLIEALQPTPSVCGLPKLEARAVVKMVEPHNRQFYTGLVGPVNFNGKTLLYVNLRCMPQGLGTGQVFTNNIPSPLTIHHGRLHYDTATPWNLTMCQWKE